MEVSVERFAVDLATPLETAAGTIGRREGVVLRVGADPPGIGEATPLPGWTESPATCFDRVGEAAAALRADDVDGALDAAEESPAARHAVSLALRDRAARRDGIPLYRALGGDGRVEAVPVNATIGAAGVEATRRAADEAVRSGYACLKVKVGVDDPDRDVARLDAIRDAHPDVALRADANGAWDRDTALRAIEGFAGLGVDYVEQPLAPGDLAGHANLRGRGVGIALDESLAELPPAAVLEADAADVLICKPMVLGGVDRARDAAITVRRAGHRAVVTTTVDAVIARTAAVHLAASLPDRPACGLATAGRLAADLAPDPAPVEDGAVTIPQGPGHGVDLHADPT